MWAGVSSTNCLFLGVRGDRQALVCQNKSNFCEIFIFDLFFYSRKVLENV